ncbi:MAG: SpoIID/LytB domain-containing protein [Plectolyngbya sp. WJT66-NPBG17]|jgi:peptidoglycan hydrolase-like amidase|nr:SpoIID/LytB domain-containing protein [Plectolyngbya sp. WJT66-NPBG17]
MKKFVLFLGLAVSIPSFTMGFTALPLTSPQGQESQPTQAASSSVFKFAMVPGKDNLEVQNATLIQKALGLQAQQLQQWQEEQKMNRDRQRRGSAVAHPQAVQTENESLPTTHLDTASTAIAQSPPPITIRVAIGQGLQTVVAGGSTPIQILDAERRVIQEIAASTAIVFQATQGIRWGSAESNTPIWLHPQNDGFVSVGNRWYRGEVLLIPQGNSILVVNSVDLEQYLYSVVGAEMPSSWSIEALKAQAIAARSYALVHRQRPANLWYDLTNTEWHQVYGGLATETSQSQASVESTRGLVLAKNGLLFEAMYAATNEIVAKHHSGYQSMSQTEAQRQASLGFDYQQILSTFYQGTHLARLTFE